MYVPELTYAKTENGNGISINEVVKTYVKKSYFCPCCNEPVIARQGQKYAWSFAHKSKKICEGALQTSLHLLAKDILLETKYFYLPAVSTEKHLLYDRFQMWPIEIHRGGIISIDSVCIETRTGNIIPDIIMTSNGKTFFVEIFVTHKIDEGKREKIRNMGISTIEIDLSNFDREITRESLTPFLVGKSKQKYWVWNKIGAEKTIEVAHSNFFTSANWNKPTEFLCVKAGFGFEVHKTYIAINDMDGHYINNGKESIYIENEMGDDIISGEEETSDGFIIYKYAEEENGEEVVFIPYHYEYWGTNEDGEWVLLINDEKTLSHSPLIFCPLIGNINNS